MKKFITNNIGYFAMLMAVIGFGSGPPFVTLALKEFFIIDLLAVRFLIAFFLMLFFCILMRVDISIKEVGLKPFLMGLLNPFLVTLSFHIGLLLTSPVNGVAIISTLPLMQPFVAKIFLNEKIEVKVIIGVLITLIGTYLLLTSQFKLGVGNYLGDLIIFLGMLCASTNEVIGRKFMQTKVNQLSVNTLLANFLCRCNASNYAQTGATHYPAIRPFEVGDNGPEKELLNLLPKNRK